MWTSKNLPKVQINGRNIFYFWRENYIIQLVAVYKHCDINNVFLKGTSTVHPQIKVYRYSYFKNL